MSRPDPTLHMVCGKIAAGKSTLAASLAARTGAVLICEDEWLAALFDDRMTSGADYLPHAAKLKAAMGPHVAALLRAGVSVVLDFPANTGEQRAWMRGIIEATGAAHALHLLDVPDAVCLERLRARNAGGTHPFTVSEDVFRTFTRHFAPPGDKEGFHIVRHGPQA